MSRDDRIRCIVTSLSIFVLAVGGSYLMQWYNAKTEGLTVAQLQARAEVKVLHLPKEVRRMQVGEDGWIHSLWSIEGKLMVSPYTNVVPDKTEDETVHIRKEEKGIVVDRQNRAIVTVMDGQGLEPKREVQVIGTFDSAHY